MRSRVRFQLLLYRMASTLVDVDVVADFIFQPPDV